MCGEILLYNNRTINKISNNNNKTIHLPRIDV